MVVTDDTDMQVYHSTSRVQLQVQCMSILKKGMWIGKLFFFLSVVILQYINLLSPSGECCPLSVSGPVFDLARHSALNYASHTYSRILLVVHIYWLLSMCLLQNYHMVAEAFGNNNPLASVTVECLIIDIP